MNILTKQLFVDKEIRGFVAKSLATVDPYILYETAVWYLGLKESMVYSEKDLPRLYAEQEEIWNILPPKDQLKKRQCIQKDLKRAMPLSHQEAGGVVLPFKKLMDLKGAL
jgi:hypothetical protein